MSHTRYYITPVCHLVKFVLGFRLYGSDIRHRETEPLISPAEHLPVEVGEQPALSLVDYLFHAFLEAPPNELHRHKLITGHHRLHLLLLWGYIIFTDSINIFRWD